MAAACPDALGLGGGQAGSCCLGAARLGRLANWVQCEPLLGSRTCSRHRDPDLRPGFLLVPWVMLLQFIPFCHLRVDILLSERLPGDTGSVGFCCIKKDSMANKFGKVLGSNSFSGNLQCTLSLLSLRY